MLRLCMKDRVICHLHTALVVTMDCCWLLCVCYFQLYEKTSQLNYFFSGIGHRSVFNFNKTEKYRRLLCTMLGNWPGAETKYETFCGTVVFLIASLVGVTRAIEHTSLPSAIQKGKVCCPVQIVDEMLINLQVR